MIVGVTFCNWAKERLEMAKKNLKEKEEQREGFADDSRREKMDMIDGMQHGLIFTVYMISVAFLIMEIMLMLYSLKLALRCSKPGMNRVAHVTMAFFFTFPYVLMSLFFSDCDAL